MVLIEATGLNRLAADEDGSLAASSSNILAYAFRTRSVYSLTTSLLVASVIWSSLMIPRVAPSTVSRYFRKLHGVSNARSRRVVAARVFRFPCKATKSASSPDNLRDKAGDVDALCKVLTLVRSLKLLVLRDVGTRRLIRYYTSAWVTRLTGLIANRYLRSVPYRLYA